MQDRKRRRKALFKLKTDAATQRRKTVALPWSLQLADLATEKFNKEKPPSRNRLTTQPLLGSKQTAATARSSYKKLNLVAANL